LKGWQSTVIQTFKEELTDFMRLANGAGGQYVIADGNAGLRAVEIANAVYRSTEERTPIQLSDSAELGNQSIVY